MLSLLIRVQNVPVCVACGRPSSRTEMHLIATRLPKRIGDHVVKQMRPVGRSAAKPPAERRRLHREAERDGYVLYPAHYRAEAKTLRCAFSKKRVSSRLATSTPFGGRYPASVAACTMPSRLLRSGS